MPWILERLRSLAARIVLDHWPFQRGLVRLARLTGLPEPATPLVTRRLRGLPLRLRFDPRSCQGRFLYYRGLHEEHLLRRLRELLRPGMTFVDVGANVGLYSVIAAYCVGPMGRVFAFEPQPAVAELLRDNLRMNGLENVVLETVALGSAPGSAALYQVTRHNVQGTLRLRGDERSVGPVLQVPVRTLSDALRAHTVRVVDGVKIDVEGAELDVLHGFEEFLTHAPPRFIALECFDRLLARFGHTSLQLVGFLEAHGYRVHRPRRGRWLPLGAGESANGDLLALLQAPPLS